MTEHTAETEIESVAVVGGGIMGAGIAEVCLRAGLPVTLAEIDAEGVAKAAGRVQRSLDRAVEAGKVSPQEAEQALGRLSCVDDLAAIASASFLIEAIVERRDAKLAVLARIAELVADPDAILASNTSSIPIVELAVAAGARGDHVLGVHFFNPAPVLSLVEIVPSLLTADSVLERTRRFTAQSLGKTPIVAPDRAGFTVNALLIPYLLSAIRMFEQGLAGAEDIDVGMVRGCAHPMGPLALADLIGLDTVMGVAETLYSEHREQLFAPPPLLQRLVAANLLGRKSGRGLYDYD
jgi:3-hydroxybutyryl-CoA dehydrogenase